MAKLGMFGIAEEFTALYELAETIEYNSETGEVIDNSETLKELFEELSEDKLEIKLENVMYIIKELEVCKIALKDEAKRLTEKAKVLENRSLRLKDMIKDVMNISGQQKIKTDKFNFSVSNRESFNYDNISMAFIPEAFVKTKQELNKNAIKDFYKNGGEVDGLIVSDVEVLSIR